MSSIHLIFNIGVSCGGKACFYPTVQREQQHSAAQSIGRYQARYTQFIWICYNLFAMFALVVMYACVLCIAIILCISGMLFCLCKGCEQMCIKHDAGGVADASNSIEDINQVESQATESN